MNPSSTEGIQISPQNMKKANPQQNGKTAVIGNGTANKMNGALDHSDQPDPDAIKMFVGQIPRSWSEKELKELFEPYGAVYQINVLRDRSQNPPQSKGPREHCLAFEMSCTMSTFGVELAGHVTIAIVHVCVRLNFGDGG
ncbi:hypothetical protein DUI87_13278 [Hirundo rustica rustica]|uniref:RRM domain-containing protein n=1 Tax=Hirundo rustica rustica TaxID=333673 RepID=A0A3M0KB93_HIRRU|nr:hypothetical protein DUI87_13278 [Hirundo rustica rustica]